MLPLAPPRLSTTTDCPSRRDSGSDARRAAVSTTPPGGLGTTRVMDLVGKAWAWTVPAPSRAAAARPAACSTMRRFMLVSMFSLYRRILAGLIAAEQPYLVDPSFFCGGGWELSPCTVSIC